MKKISLTIELTGYVENSVANQLAIAWKHSGTTAEVPVDKISLSTSQTPKVTAKFDFCQLTKLDILG